MLDFDLFGIADGKVPYYMATDTDRFFCNVIG